MTQWASEGQSSAQQKGVASGPRLVGGTRFSKTNGLDPAQIELLENPGELLATAFSDPGAALAALGSIGADMSEEEREEATDMVVATVVAAGAAMNAVGAATGSTGGSTSGGSSGGGNSGGGGSSGESKGVRRRKS